ncbi:hypothetical protein BCR43DRAFT_487094 [Syncephalastrum racemosum]|uniref:F-box domain-containing protein n=1 Tax=Syncephalastrum racemosum TaxID=13706 RepID=A0A1X2HQH3_SYNRA|nr:hypothetical protein BCR43DRAFT_487094 [Syncephalastrum racemosum]
MTRTIRPSPSPLPLEVLLHILSLVPLSSFSALYEVFSSSVVDQALCDKLRRRVHPQKQCQEYDHHDHLLDLTSTNCHELLAPFGHRFGNSSALGLHFVALDLSARMIWFFPCFASCQSYFRVKDAYVSHGKLVLTPVNTPGSQGGKKEMTLTSLWDIRKQLPPARAGTFSGASEWREQTPHKQMTINPQGCIIDACLLGSHVNTNNSHHDNDTSIDDNITSNDLSTQQQQKSSECPPRPALPSSYTRRLPAFPDQPAWGPASFDPTSGYFLVERVALSIEHFLGLFNTSPVSS